MARVYARDDTERPAPEAERDVEERLYEGFTPDSDRFACERLQTELRAKAAWPEVRFTDKRLNALAARLHARLRPGELSPAERRDWERFVAHRLTTEHPRRRNVAAYRQEVAERLDTAKNAAERDVLLALQSYGEELAGNTRL